MFSNDAAGFQLKKSYASYVSGIGLSIRHAAHKQQCQRNEQTLGKFHFRFLSF